MIFRSTPRAGINRVSIGVQSFVPSEIATLGQKAHAGRCDTRVALARAARIRSVSLDLMFARSGANRRRAGRSRSKRAMALGVDHISTYGLND